MAEKDAQIEVILRENLAYLRALAVKFAPARGVSDDIVQQVSLEFIRKKEQWNLDDDVKPLFAVMTRNVARRFWRETTQKMAPEMRKLAEHIRTIAEEATVPLYGDEEIKALHLCMEKLPEKSRKLIEVHYYLDVSSVELAQRLSVTADAVRRSLFRLREQLRKCVQDTLGGKDYGGAISLS